MKDNPELLHRYEESEARYIMQLPEDYDTISLDLSIEKEQMNRLIAVLAELNLSLDEWIAFKLKELIIADKLMGSKKKSPEFAQ